MKRKGMLVSVAAALALAVVFFTPRSARAGDIRFNVSLSGAGSEWKGDAALWGGLGMTYRFYDLVGVYALGRLGYGSVDERILTLLAIGAQIWGRIGPTRPYLRVAFIHQHEEPVPAATLNPGGTVFGVGDGIRHRGGAEGALGLDYTFFTRDHWSAFANAETSFAGFPNSSGPGWYILGGLGLGFQYSI
ncbi:MAG: hypothetical protein U0441_23565 [Polyangiaceae bacterium]